ncbi:MAG: ABC transporter ATP-binding protein [Gammaproteobacteria bacterium]|nr:ABC transporter ATP-binding protein [Gammaproteobacteria bacterium]
MTLLTVDKLSVDFYGEAVRKTAVEDVAFSIRRGETFCLVGESGSGKSVTALSLMRLLPDNARMGSETRICFFPNGSTPPCELTSLNDEQFRAWRGRRMAMIFQEPMSSLNPVQRIGEQIAEAVMHNNPQLGEEAVHARVIELLQAVKIPEPALRIDAYPHHLSGGQCQRVMIAMALAGNPELLIADEPTTALDVTIQAEILGLLQSLQQSHGMSLLFITHDLGIVAKIADRVAVMRNGHIVETGEARQVIRAPTHPYTQELWQSLPQNLQRPATVLQSEADRQHPANAILRLNNLSLDFPVRSGLFRRVSGSVKAVDNVTLSIGRGEILALVGESGCGKTTLGQTILRLLEPSAGEIIFKGEHLETMQAARLRKLRGQLQIIFQDSAAALNPRLTLVTSLTEVLKVHGIGDNQAEREARTAAILEEVQLSADLLYRYPHQLSGGQRQRVGIARALLTGPELIVCDEVTSALDVSVQARVLELLLRLREERHLSLLFITHDIGVVEFISDRTAVMCKGRIVEYGDTRQVCREPQDKYTKQLISAVPQINQ